MDHVKKIVYFKKPILCSLCNDYIWGVNLQGLQCTKCYRCFHSACHLLYNNPCNQHAYLALPPPTIPAPIDLKTWSVNEVCEWMAVVNLHRYSEVFRKNNIDGIQLESLNKEKIGKMNIKDDFHNDSILISIQVLKQPSLHQQQVKVTNVTPSYHLLSIYSFTSLQVCHVCDGYLLGIFQQGYRCKVCGLCCHRRCSVLQLPLFEKGCVNKNHRFIEDSMFGKSLVEFSTTPPSIITLCAEELQNRALNSNVNLIEFYIKSPSSQNVLQLKNSITENSDNVYTVPLHQHEAETIGGIMKKFLRDLSEPVVPESFYMHFIAIVRDGMKTTDSKALLRQLPSCNYLTLEYLINHFTSDNLENVQIHEKFAHIFNNILLRPPWNQIMDIVNNSVIQSQTVHYLMAQKSLLFTLDQHSWYFGDITQDEVDDLMMNIPDGSFLVRNASKLDPTKPYTLALRVNGMTKLVKIIKYRGQFGLNKNPPFFPSIPSLVFHYFHTSFASFDSSLDITLQQPLERMDKEKLRKEFKDACEGIRTLMVTMKDLNSKHDTLNDLVQMYQNDINAINKVVGVYAQQLEISKRLIKDRACTRDMKIYGEEGIAKMERKKETLETNMRRIEVEIGKARNDLFLRAVSLEEEKEKMDALYTKKEIRKKTLIELNESQSNVKLLQRGMDVQVFEEQVHRDESTWYVEGDKSNAEQLLKGKASGTFLIRPHLSIHALSFVSQNNEVFHVVINREDTGYGFENPYFIHPQLIDLVLHYKDVSLKEHNDDHDVTLQFPVFS